MKKLFLILTILLCTGCVQDHGRFTVLSNKLIDIQDFELDKADRVKYIKGSDTSHIFIFVPTKLNPNLGAALSDAFTKADGDVMTDVTVTSWFWYIPYLYGYFGWTVEGDVVKTRKK